MQPNQRDLIIQIVLLGCLFFGLTGAGFIIGWESLKPYRTLHKVLSIATIFIGAGIARWRFVTDRETFFLLEPARSIKIFFEIPPAFSLSFLALIYFITQLSSQILMHAGLETVLWDFGFYDQVLWNTFHGHFLISSIQGGIHVFSSHIKPILVLFAPIYLITDSPIPLFAVITLIISSSLIAVYLITRHLTSSHTIALIFAFCVFFYPPLKNGINYPIHMQTLADPFILFGFYFALKQGAKSALLFFVLALMCKENIALDVLGVGLFLISKRQKTGWIAAAISLVWMALVVLLIEPYFKNPYSSWNKWGFYSHLTILKLEPWLRLLTPNPLVFLLLLFGPFLFLSFKCKGWYWLLGPSLAFRLLSGMGELRLTTVHRSAGLNALVFISAIYGMVWFLNQIKTKNHRWLYWVRDKNTLMASLVLASILFAGTPQLLSIDRYLIQASKPEHQRIVRVLDSIPAPYSVLASESLSAHLAHRPFLYTFFNVFKNSPLEEASKHPDLLVVDETTLEPRQTQAMEEFIQGGYRLIFEIDFMKIYERPNETPVISNELIARWEGFKTSQPTPYRKIVWLWYQRTLLLFSLLLFILLLIRSSRQTPNLKTI